MGSSTGRLPQLLLTAALSLLLIALIGVTRSLLIANEEEVAPISHSGDLGETVDARQFTITVQEVELARGITATDSFGEPSGQDLTAADTDIWVIVHVTITAASEQLTVRNPLLEVADGYSYAASTHVQSTMDGEVVEAGIPRSGALVFEIPTERLAEPALRVGAGGIDQRLSAEAVIDLGLGENELATLLDEAAESVSVPAPDYA